MLLSTPYSTLLKPRAGRGEEEGEDLFDIAVACEHEHDVDLFHLDIRRVVVAAEEDLDIIRKDPRPLLRDQLYVAKCHVLDFGFRRQEGDERRRQLFGVLLDGLGVGQVRQVVEHHLGGCLAFAFQKQLFQCYSVLPRLVPTGVCAKNLLHKPLNLYVHIH